ncbi:MAG: tetratricopeptide repeat protein [Gammaproteobacteria bacterium]
MKRAVLRAATVGVAITLVLLFGCAGRQRATVQEPIQEQRPTVPRPPSTAEETAPPGAPQPAPQPEQRAGEPGPPPSAAVVALLDTAEQRARAGNLDNAAAVVERALRLEPQNPLLWHRLATVRLQQGQFAQAASLAAKSNALAGNNRQLQASNWDTIAQAKEQLGDAAAAHAARKKARALR